MPRVRPAHADDCAQIAQLVRTAFADVATRFALTPDSCPKHPSNCQPVWVSEAMRSGARYFVLEEESEMTGCVALEQPQPELCYLERLAVLPVYRCRGNGTALVRHACREAHKLGAERVEIGIIADHHELAAWYGAFGFAAFRRARFPHLPFEVQFMRLPLHEKT